MIVQVPIYVQLVPRDHRERKLGQCFFGQHEVVEQKKKAYPGPPTALQLRSTKDATNHYDMISISKTISFMVTSSCTTKSGSIDSFLGLAAKF